MGNIRGVRVWVAAFLSAAGISVKGQVLLSGGVYQQDFNTLPAAGAGAWVNNATLQGWYVSRSASPGIVTNLAASNGNGTTGGLFSFGDPGSSDRALGTLASGGTGRMAFGVRLLNDTGTALSGFTISLAGEQWRSGSTNAQRLLCAFRLGSGLTNADAAGDLDWTSEPALDVEAPVRTGAGVLPGNDAACRVALGPVALAGVVLPPGQELFLRWEDADDAGYDDALALDDFAVEFGVADARPPVPEAGAISLLTYNTHGNQVEDWSTNAWQVRAIGRQLQALRPDLVTLNEIPETNTWQMPNWSKAFLPGYFLATNSEGDGYIRNVIASRFPIAASRSWLHGADLGPFGAINATFKRDLFEAEILPPGFPVPLHVFCVHLKSGQETGDSLHRSAEAAAVSDFFARCFLPAHPFEPYVLSGDFNEDIARAPASDPASIRKIIGPGTGLQLLNPLNAVTGSELTFSIQADALTRRYDYIFPCLSLCAGLQGCGVIRSDLLESPPYPMRTNDDRWASDHLPVMAVFGNPFLVPVRFESVGRTGSVVTLSWRSVPGLGYRVERSVDLAQWNVCSEQAAASGVSVLVQSNVPDAACFYRLLRSP
ncbi:MAG: hypothetical protein U1F98_08850 [Verrucomicrobiota bacterium]